MYIFGSSKVFTTDIVQMSISFQVSFTMVPGNSTPPNVLTLFMLDWCVSPIKTVLLYIQGLASGLQIT